MSWQDPGDGVTAHSYRYKAVKGSDGWVRWSRVPVGVTEVTVRGLDSGVKYRFQVRALKDSRRSHSVSVKAKPTAPPETELQREDPEPPADPPPAPDPDPPPFEPPGLRNELNTGFVVTIGGKSYDLNRTRESLELCLLGNDFGQNGNYDFTSHAGFDFENTIGCEHHRPRDKELSYICVRNRGIIKNDGGEVVYAPKGYSGRVDGPRGDCSNLAPVKGPICPGKDSEIFDRKRTDSELQDDCKTRSQLAQARAKADTPLKCAMEWNSRWCVVNEQTGAGYCAAKRVEAGFF